MQLDFTRSSSPDGTCDWIFSPISSPVTPELKFKSPPTGALMSPPVVTRPRVFVITSNRLPLPLWPIVYVFLFGSKRAWYCLSGRIARVKMNPFWLCPDNAPAAHFRFRYSRYALRSWYRRQPDWDFVTKQRGDELQGLWIKSCQFLDIILWLDRLTGALLVSPVGFVEGSCSYQTPVQRSVQRSGTLLQKHGANKVIDWLATTWTGFF